MTQISNGGLKAYMRDVSKYPLLKWNVVQDLFQQMKDPNTPESERDRIKTKIVNSNLRFVISIAKKYQQNGIPLLDLIQEGNIGLMTGIDRFDPSRGFRLTTYVAFWIRQAITKHLSDRARVVRLPTHIVAIVPAVRQAAMELQDAGLPVDPEAIAERLNLTADTVKATLGASGGTKSLTPVSAASENHADGEVEEHVSSVGPEEYMDTLKLREAIRKSFSRLTQREEQVLRLRFGCAEALDDPRYMLSQEGLDKLRARAARRDQDTSNEST
jgi:RNA polymerase primary sigma factor